MKPLGLKIIHHADPFWMFPKTRGYRCLQWKTMENLIKMDDLGIALFSETLILLSYLQNNLYWPKPNLHQSHPCQNPFQYQFSSKPLPTGLLIGDLAGMFQFYWCTEGRSPKSGGKFGRTYHGKCLGRKFLQRNWENA